jgi:catechol 2,3-dioxygenase-like lactoylglutathione lyase family enzyme
MFTTLARTVLLTPDQEAARRWYVEVLGFDVGFDQTIDGERYLHVTMADGSGLWLIPPADETERVLVGRQAGRHPFLVLYTADLEKVSAQLEEHGVGTFEHRDDPDSRSLQFRDLHGNLVVAAQLRS